MREVILLILRNYQEHTEEVLITMKESLERATPLSTTKPHKPKTYMSHEIVDKLIRENTELKNNLEVHANMAVQLTVTRNELMAELEKLNEKIKVLESHPKIVKVNKNDERTFVSIDDLFEIRRADKAEIKRLNQLLNGC